MDLKVTLSPSSIDRAINDLKEYKRTLPYKVKELRDRVAKEIAIEAQSLFDSSTVNEDFLGIPGSARMADVTVTVSSRDDSNISVIIANGRDAIFVEFGAGITHNVASGGSPHPKGAELGFTIGSYGYGLGKFPKWYLPKDQFGSGVSTTGTPATMPMIRSVESVRDKIIKIAKEVFK